MSVVLRRGDMKVGRKEDMEEFTDDVAEDFRWDIVGGRKLNEL